MSTELWPRVETPIWAPSAPRAAATRLRAFMDWVGGRHATSLTDYGALHAWSIGNLDAFWSAVWEFCGVVARERGSHVVEHGEPFWRTRFFPDARLNFAQNLLAHAPQDDNEAMVFAREDGLRRTVSGAELRHLVSRLQQALLAADVGAGDRVAAWLPNAPETYALMLAVASIGAVFSSTSPDFGVDGAVDRFGQIEPAVLVGCDAYLYGGKRFDCLAKLAATRDRLPTVRSVAVLGFVDPSPDLGGVRDAVTFDGWIEPFPASEIAYAPLSFDHPLYVLYSSGTTGAPKCIVHRAGGVLLKHLTEHQLHCDIRSGDRVTYFTTAGWMMWNWLASAMASGATLVLYDGSPMHPHPATLFDLADETGVTLFGTSAGYLSAVRKAGLEPRVTHALKSLRTITSTGSPLGPDGFAYVYEHVKPDVHLASISGGTDLCGCLVGGDPTGPVWAGEIQRPALGLDIAVVDDEGRRLGPGVPGELVCANAFPSMPLGFLGDDGDQRYRAAYFERFPGLWHQGDFAMWTDHGGVVISGRSDATLNPGGVRIGSAEVTRPVEGLPEIAESLAIGQEWNGDTRVVLFVVLRPGAVLTDDLVDEIRRRIRTHASPRHVPAKVIAVPDLPRTRSNKLSELAVREVVHGRPVANVEALANPECLEVFRNLPELAT